MSRLPRRAHRVTALVCVAVVVSALLGACGTPNTPAATSTASESSSSAAASAPEAPPSSDVKPTIVLVHGAWADTSSWDGEVTRLQRQGTPPERSRTRWRPDDRRRLRRGFLDTITGPIVLVGHSYGGSVITNAAAGNPNVKALVYVDAAAPAVGETNGSLSGLGPVLKQKPGTLFDKVAVPRRPPEPSTCT